MIRAALLATLLTTRPAMLLTVPLAVLPTASMAPTFIVWFGVASAMHRASAFVMPAPW